MKIVAKAGEHRVLVDVGNGDGFVADTLHQIKFEPKAILDITKIGTWKDHIGTQKLLKEIETYEEI